MTTTCEATGLIVLERITPVISAIFESFTFNDFYPLPQQDRTTLFCIVSRQSASKWENVFRQLSALAVSHRLIQPGRFVAPADLLKLLSRHFGCERDPEIVQIIDGNDFDGEADLDTLLIIATRLDDGHNLSEICLQSCWRHDSHKLIPLSGEARFSSCEFTTSADCAATLSLGSKVREALLTQDPDEAASAIFSEADRLIRGIRDPHQRREVRHFILTKLMDDFPNLKLTKR